MIDQSITQSRIDGYSKLLFWMFLAAMAVWTALSLPDLIDPRGKPVGYDFMAFWSASHLALQGDAAGAYDPRTILAAHNAAVPGVDRYYLWHYPPTYFLTILPLAALPYLVALVLFLAANLFVWRLMVAKVLPLKEAQWAILALPAGLICLVHGQNGFLTAALLGGALYALDRRPILAGVLIGLLAIKPHLGLLIPVALAASGRWRTFIAAGVSVTAFCAASAAVLGVDVWLAFLENLPRVRHYVDSGWLPWEMMPTPYVLGLSLRLGPDVAMGLQVAAALCAAVIVWRTWRARAASFNVKAAVLCASSLLMSPYMFYYDLTILAVAGFWLVREGMATGFRKGEPSALALAWATPILMLPVMGVTTIQPAVFVTLLLLWIGYRRACPPRPRTAQAPSASLAG